MEKKMNSDYHYVLPLISASLLKRNLRLEDYISDL